MVQSLSILVVVACTLAGGLRQNGTGHGAANATNGTCFTASNAIFPECHVLDESVTPTHILVPWGLVLGVMLFLGMPTLLLSSKSKEKGMRTLAGNLFKYLCLLLCTSMTDHLGLSFAVTIHACSLLLVHMDVSDSLVGGPGWWSLRYLAAAGLLGWEVTMGPPMSIVHWPDTANTVTCAYLGHLIGSIIPGVALDSLRLVITFARYVHVHED